MHNRIFSFIDDFKIGTMMNKSGIRKLWGASPLALFTTIFMLPFEGNNFFQGIVNNAALPFKKDAAYGLLNNPRHNWRRIVMGLAVKVCCFFCLLTDKKRERVLIFDDNTFNRSRSKAVELLAWIFDHNTGQHLKGFKLLTLGWSDGASFLPLDFILCSSAQLKNRVQDIRKKVDKRTCGYKRRLEAITKSTDHIVPLQE